MSVAASELEHFSSLPWIVKDSLVKGSGGQCEIVMLDPTLKR